MALVTFACFEHALVTSRRASARVGVRLFDEAEDRAVVARPINARLQQVEIVAQILLRIVRGGLGPGLAIGCSPQVGLGPRDKLGKTE